jgi:hypothetical protein
MIMITLAMAGAFGYALFRDREAQADAVDYSDEVSSNILKQGSAPGTPAGKQPTRNSDKTLGGDSSQINSENSEKTRPESVDKHPLPMVPVKNEPSPLPASVAERTQRELRTVYADWAATAARGEWGKHMSFYADRVEYFSNGLLPRSKIETRKRNIFSGLDSYTLRFSDTPQIHLKNFGGMQEADVIFNRQWVLRRGRKKPIKGEARGLITLRRDSHGWRIVSERQIKK